MSGPKVVRIVTRDEVLALCRGQLARVDAALAEWIRVGSRNDCVDDAAIEMASGRRDQLASLIAADRFLDLQKQAPVEEAFLREDLQRRLASKAAKEAEARSRKRRETQVAESVLRRLRSAGQSLEIGLEQALERGEPQAIARGLELLTERGHERGEAAIEASRLKDETSPKSYSEWLGDQSQAVADPEVERIEIRLGELAGLIDAPTLAGWRSRLEEIESSAPARRALLIDGLEVETSRSLKEAQKRATAVSNLILLLAELDAAGASMEFSRDDLDTIALPEVIRRTTLAQIKLKAKRLTEAAVARRAAVLKGLAELGYEVTEGMATSSPEDGRLVVRSASRPEYGVELNASAASERVQLRAVAFDTDGSVSDPSRDRDAETIWCGDLATLQTNLEKVGGSLKIERALPVGATPLKRIALPSQGAARSTDVPVLKGRTAP